MRTQLAQLISVVTVVPLIGGATSSLLYVQNPHWFGDDGSWYGITLALLTFVPLLAYPLSIMIPSVRGQGRKGQRDLAFLLGLVGFLLGMVVSYVWSAPWMVMVLFGSYLASCVVLIVINKGVSLKASGHACGLSGPLTILIYLMGYKALLGVLALPVVFWARVQLGRHTYKELIAGTIVGCFSTIIVLLVAR